MKTEKKGIIAFDGDSVLVDFFKGFLLFLKTKGHCIKHVEHLIGSTRFVPTEEITKVDCKEYNKQIMKEFAESGFLGNLSPFQIDAVEILNDLHTDHHLAVVTCIGTTDKIIEERERNLKSIHGDVFLEIRCIEYGESKEKHLRELAEIAPVVAFIDDRTKHLEEAKRANVKPLLLSRGEHACLKGAEDFTVISSLSEIRNHI